MLKCQGLSEVFDVPFAEENATYAPRRRVCAMETNCRSDKIQYLVMLPSVPSVNAVNQAR